MTPDPRRGAARARRHAPEPGLPQSRTVLLMIDVINPLQFDGAEDLAPPALEAAAANARLKADLAREGVPAVYVNDNFGHWRSDFRALVARCRRLGGPAAALVRRLAPGPDDLTVLKPRHSAFHETPLELLLTQMGARDLVVTGLATDLCVQFSASDAFVRGYRLWIPEDCTAAESLERKRAALDWMALALKGRTEPAYP
jgi:nicotinamidase-related amidase